MCFYTHNKYLKFVLNISNLFSRLKMFIKLNFKTLKIHSFISTNVALSPPSPLTKDKYPSKT